MRHRTRLAMLTFLAACGSDGTGPDGGASSFAVTTVTPTDGATDAETGALVMAHFNAPVSPPTLTSASFTLSTGGTPLAVAVAYDGASQTAQLVGPLLPGNTYRAAVTTAVEDTAGRTLATAREWSFSTRTWQSVTLDQGGLPSLARDATGRLHLTYIDGANLKYATCPGDCASAGNWQMVTLDQGRDLAALASEATGRLHVSYFHFVTDTLGEIRYATCAADCTTAANWQTVTLDQGIRAGVNPLVVDGVGRLHLVYFHSGAQDLKYATCAANCESAANWQTVGFKHVEAVGDFSGSLMVDRTGRVHFTYEDLGNLSTPGLAYATCPADCAAAGNWQAATIDPGFSNGRDSRLAVDATGRVHVIYLADFASQLRYATCALECATPESWQIVGIVENGGLGGEFGGLAVDDKGRLHAIYERAINFQTTEIGYATCVTGCTSATSWEAKVIAQSFGFGTTASLVVDATGRVHASYTTTALQYSE